MEGLHESFCTGHVLHSTHTRRCVIHPPPVRGQFGTGPLPRITTNRQTPTHNSFEPPSDHVIVYMHLEHQVGSQTHNGCKEGASVEACSARSAEHCDIILVGIVAG